MTTGFEIHDVPADMVDPLIHPVPLVYEYDVVVEGQGYVVFRTDTRSLTFNSVCEVDTVSFESIYPPSSIELLIVPLTDVNAAETYN